MHSFRAKRIAQTYTWEVPAPPDQVFPLLCPVREYEWIPGWSCDLIYSESGRAEQDCIFRTTFAGEGEEVWVITRHEPDARRFEVVRFIEGSRVVRVDVSLSAPAPDSTTLVWTQTITALDDAGNAYIDSFSEEAQRARMGLLGKMLGHFCDTGKMLELADAST